MNNLYTSIALGLIAEERIVLTTNDYVHAFTLTKELLVSKCGFREADINVVDVQQSVKKGKTGVLDEMVLRDDGDTFAKVVIWQNLEKVSKDQQKNELVPLLNDLDGYDTGGLPTERLESVKICGRTLKKQDLFVLVLIMESEQAQQTTYQYLKERLWFAQHHHHDVGALTDDLTVHRDFQAWINTLKYQIFPRVYVAPDILRYIYSLVVHARNHRLCSLDPFHSRLSPRSLHAITKLARALVAFRRGSDEDLFVTPDFCKIAMRKVGYWLIDWESHSSFAPGAEQQNNFLDYNRRIEISMLSGDWYGSDYTYVERYIDSCRSHGNPRQCKNRVVEDAINTVHPPM